MQLPDHDTERGKVRLAGWYASLEKRILNECAALGKSGFADRRLAAAAYQKFEEAFLLMRKALRIKAEQRDPDDYGKVDQPGPTPEEFRPDPESQGVSIKDHLANSSARDAVDDIHGNRRLDKPDPYTGWDPPGGGRDNA